MQAGPGTKNISSRLKFSSGPMLRIPADSAYRFGPSKVAAVELEDHHVHGVIPSLVFRETEANGNSGIVSARHLQGSDALRAEIREHVRSNEETDYAILDPHARDDKHTVRCVWYRTERCTSSIARRYQGNAADSRETRRRASRSKTKGD